MSSSKDDTLSTEQLSALGNAVRTGEPFSGGLPGSMQLLEMTLPRPKEPEKKPEPEAKEDPKLVEARAEEKAAKEELAQIGDRLKYLESGARLAAKRAGVDWDALGTTPTPSKPSLQETAEQRAEQRLRGTMTEIATRRAVAGKRTLDEGELRARARRQLSR